MFSRFEQYLSEIHVLGEVKLRAKKGSELFGFNDGEMRCLLNEFNITNFHYETDILLCSLTLSKGFLVSKGTVENSGQRQSKDVLGEVEYECVDIEVKYCILRHCIVEANVEVIPGLHMQEVSFVEPPNLDGG